MLLLMGTGAGRLGQVADRTFADRSRGALNLYELDPIVRLAAWGNRMRAVVAGFAVNPTVPSRQAKQCIILCILRCRCRYVAGIAARLI